MATNIGWPEAFGFSVAGGDPVVISSIDEGGSAQQAGLQQGDVLVEVDGENVQHCSVREVLERARRSEKVPPSLLVVSRVRTFEIPRSRSTGGFGITLRGDSPVYIRSVDFDSPARSAGVRSGDLLLEVNCSDVRYSTKMEALELLKQTGHVLQLKVVAGGLDTHPLLSSSSSQADDEKEQQRKAQLFHDKVHYYLQDDSTKQSHLYTLLRLYLKSQDIDSLSHSLDILLETDIERRLLGDIRLFIDPHHVTRFDALLSYKAPKLLSAQHQAHGPSPLAPRACSASAIPRQRSLPDIAIGRERLVTVDRSSGGFGFSLSGNAPVFIRSVDGLSAAAAAGIKPGEYILEINGLDVRSATHSQVVRLLKGSGTQPSLLLSSHPPTNSLQAQSKGIPATISKARTTLALVSPGDPLDVRRQSKAFKEKLDQVLPSGERKEVFHQLSQYASSKDLPKLVSGLADILSDSNKCVLFHHICRLLPEEAQAEFDQIAAATIANRGTAGTPHSSPHPSLQVTQPPQLPATEHLLSPPAGGETLLTDTPIGIVGTPPLTGGITLSSRVTVKEDLIPAEVPGSLGEEKDRSAAGERRGRRQKKENLRHTTVQCPSSPVPSGASHSTASSSPPPSLLFSPPPPPPPPLPGGIPPPPPPPPLTPGSTPGHPAMKRVNWEKLHGLEGTIWSDMSGLQESLEYSELEKQFATSAKKQQRAAKNKEGRPEVLDHRKAYNIAILLGHLKLPVEVIKRAVLACDMTTFSEQHLQQLETFAPDSKECLEYASYHGNTAILSLPDRFSCEMSTIPFYKERLKALLFKLHFRERVDEISMDLTAIVKASTQLHTSKNFKKILELILAVGNYMNIGSRHAGSADGFRIKYLTQLKDLRATDNKSSLLHFIAATAQRKFPQALEFQEDLAPVKKAARVSGKTLEVEINELRSSLAETKRTLQEISSSQHPDTRERFPEVFGPFVGVAQGELSELVKLYTTMKRHFERATRFFGEDPAHTQVDEFFSVIATFIVDFESALEDNKRAIQQQLLQEKRGRRSSLSTQRRRPGVREEEEEVVDLRAELARRAASRKMEYQGERSQMRSQCERVEEDQLQFDHETHF